MVSLKAIKNAYYPKRYRSNYERRTTRDTFLGSAGFYAGLFGFLLVFRWAAPLESSKVVASPTFWRLSNTLRIVLLTIIFLDLLFAYVVRYPRAEKYLAIIAYLFNLILYPAAILGVFSLILADPYRELFRGGIAVLLGLLVMFLYHTVLVIVAVSRNNLDIRDRYLNMMGNILGPIMLICVYIGHAFLDEFPDLMWFSLCIIVGMIYSVFLFQLPRVTHYWWHKPKDTLTQSPREEEKNNHTPQAENRITRQVRWRKK